MSDFEKFKEQLPSKKKFYSSLTGKKMSSKEYEHVLKVWNKFETKSMKNYHDLHLKSDTLLLADVFEKYINNSLKNYGFCPSHYLKAQTLSWDAMVNMTKVELERIPDPDMYIFFGKGTKANNKYLKFYDPKQESKHIYSGTNNLYGYAIPKFLSISGFKQII